MRRVHLPCAADDFHWFHKVVFVFFLVDLLQNIFNIKIQCIFFFFSINFKNYGIALYKLDFFLNKNYNSL